MIFLDALIFRCHRAHLSLSIVVICPSRQDHIALNSIQVSLASVLILLIPVISCQFLVSSSYDAKIHRCPSNTPSSTLLSYDKGIHPCIFLIIPPPVDSSLFVLFFAVYIFSFSLFSALRIVSPNRVSISFFVRRSSRLPRSTVVVEICPLQRSTCLLVVVCLASSDHTQERSSFVCTKRRNVNDASTFP